VEEIEDLRDMGAPDPDAGILDHEAQPLAMHPHLERYPAFAGVLNGVVEEVHEHLAQAALVAHDLGRDLGPARTREHESMALCARPHDGGDPVQARPEAEWGGVQHERPGLDLGRVQDVVDEPQEVLAGVLDDLLDDLQGLALVLGQTGAAPQDLGVAEHGVERGA
jgi:hypothetical protein